MAAFVWTGAVSALWSVGANWSVGGVPQAAAPTAADDAAVGSGTGATNNALTIDAGAVAKSVDFNGYTGTATHSAAVTLTIGDGTAGTGNIALRLASTMTYTRSNATTSAISLNSTSATVQTITTNGKTLGNLTFATAGSWKLADNCTTSSGGTTTLTAGTLDLNGKTLDTGIWSSSNSTARTLNGNAGTVILRSTGTAWSMATTTNYTSDNNFTASFLATGSQTISGAITFATISRTGSNNATDILQLATNTTATNLTLNTCSFKSNTAGTARTITLTNAPTFTSVGTITDITIPASVKVDAPSTVINGGNNTGIAFLSTPSMIQSAGVSVTTPAGSATASFANATRDLLTSESCIAVLIQARTASANPTFTVTDSAGNVYSAVPSTYTIFGTAQGAQEYWWCPNAKGGVTSVTVNASINSNFGVTAVEMSDANTVDQVSQSTGNSTTAATGPTGTTTAANELILGLTGAHSGGAVTTSAGFQMLVTQISTSAPILIMRAGFRTATATGTFSWSTTISTGLWAATIVTFKYQFRGGGNMLTLSVG